MVIEVINKHRARLNHIVQFGNAGHTQEALMLLWQCARPRIVFLLQCIPYHIAPEAFDDSHRDLIDAFARIVGASADLDEADEVTLGRIALPFRHGGQGLTNPSHIADQALVANWAACAPFLAKTAPALRRIVDHGGNS